MEESNKLYNYKKEYEKVTRVQATKMMKSFNLQNLLINLCRPFSLTTQIVPQHLVIQNKLKPDKNMK